ncbi:MAG TPA: YsnF/AvaK domain-containing protein [Capillimicrobium sp.]|jgi:uncharacterized protein (TIGR02271 family)
MSLPVAPDALAGWHARDADGVDLGEIEAVFGTAGQQASNFLGLDAPAGIVMVPLDGASLDREARAVDLPYRADAIAAAPVIAPDAEQLDADLKRRIADHFRSDRAPTLVAGPVDRRDPVEAEIVLNEEQLVVETERVPADRVRLRKEIVEEEVTVTVVLRREELIVERAPVGDDEALVERASDPLADGGELEIVLWAEEPIVTTRSVPVETVRLRRDVTTETRDLSATVRRERAAVEHAAPTDSSHLNEGAPR